MTRAHVAIAAFLTITAAAHADVTYIYTGQNYNYVYGPYTQDERVTGSFTIAAPLAANLFLQQLTVLAYHFNDGIQDVSQNTAGTVADYEVSTDSLGHIKDYDLLTYIFDGATGDLNTIDAYYDPVPNNGRPSPVKAGSDAEGVSFWGFAGSTSPGTLVESTTVTPEPSSLVLLSTGLLGLGTMMRRRLLRG